MSNCPGCSRPEPADYCWLQRTVDCPSNRPPRNVSALNLWVVVNDQEQRIKDLELLTQWMGTLLGVTPDALRQAAAAVRSASNVTNLDDKRPPSCCGGGPQWGHSWECPRQGGD